MTQGTLPRSFKAIRVRGPAVEHVGRRPSKINESCICWVKMKPMKQGSLPRSFKATRVGLPAIDRVDRTAVDRVNRRPSEINESCICSDKMIPMTQERSTRSFKAIRVDRPAVDHVDRHPSKINESLVHMLGQNEAYDTRKPPKKFQGNPTCAQPNIRWTTTWIAVGR
ncbi:uncharacterized protein G2W53_027068 [Senna tora]|uniref:Uncharacterized protein n=1 Tax=Senna tora TaxID=362788 RepID=A0A834WI18_9FABA|nr:uncharacterized protein G2W53_027068 [Senna tora]